MSEARKTKNAKQLAFVRDLMYSGEWMSLRDMERELDFCYAQASISARIREMKNFGLEVEKRRHKHHQGGKFVWQYRLAPAVSPVERNTAENTCAPGTAAGKSVEYLAQEPQQMELIR